MDESIVRHLEQPQVGTLTLSAAIRIGAKLRPQCFFGGFHSDGKTCAIAAAAEAIYGDYTFAGKFAMTLTHDFRIPLGEIYTRNDAGQSREEIADWLESQGL